MSEPAPASRLRRDFYPLLGVALGIRIVVAGYINVISHDGAVYYMPRALAMVRGRFEEGFTANIPFLYPLMSALFYSVTGEMEWAGKLVSILAGTLTLIPVYFIGRTLAGHKTGVLAAALAAFAPLLVRYSGHAQSDALFGLLAVSAFAVGLIILREPTLWRGVAAGALGGAATLVRPEALGLLPVVGLFLVVGCIKREYPLRKAAASFGLLALAFAVLAFPQVWITHERTGVWTLSAKAGAIFRLSNDPSFDPAAPAGGGDGTAWEEAFEAPEKYIPFSPLQAVAKDPSGFAAHYLHGLDRMLRYLPRDLGVALFAAALAAGILHFRRGGRLAAGEGYLLAAVAFYLLALPVFYTSRRMWVPLIPLLLPPIARGLMATLFPESGPRRTAPLEVRRWPRLALLLLFALTLPQTFRPVAKYGWEWGQSPEKDGGHLIRQFIVEGDPVIGHDGRVAFYAGGTHVPLPPGGLLDFLEFALDRGATWFAYDRAWLEENRPELLARQEIYVGKEGVETRNFAPDGSEVRDTAHSIAMVGRRGQTYLLSVDYPAGGPSGTVTPYPYGVVGEWTSRDRQIVVEMIPPLPLFRRYTPIEKAEGR